MAKNEFWINKKGQPMKGDRPFQSCPTRRAELAKEQEEWENMSFPAKILTWLIIGVIGLLPEIIGYYFFW